MLETLGVYGVLLWPPLILVVATILRQLLPSSLHLQNLVGPWAMQLREKTHHSNRSLQQQQLAGALGLVLLSAPMLVIAFMAMVHPLTQLLLLTLMLPNRNVGAQPLAQQLRLGHKKLARDTLSKLTIRDTDALSSYGIAKASIESMLERYAAQFFGVAFWYLLSGLPFAIMLWLGNELARHWHIDKPKLATFGRAAHYVAALMMLPVNAMLGFTLSCYGALSAPWKLRHQLQGQWDKRNRQWLQLCFACSLGVQLSGPWQLAGQRIERPRLGPEIACQPQDMLRAQRMLRFAQVLWLLIPMLTAFAITWVWHNG